MNEYEQPVRRGARRRGLRSVPRQTLAALAVAACFTGGSALANPTNPTVAQGVANFANPAANVLNVTTATSKTIINWGSFSIAAGELTKFLQPSAASAVLNRVAAGNPSQILGALQSNGRVFLINPSGIIFGAGAQIDVAGLIASTLNLSDTDFLAGRMRFTETSGAGSLINQGAITTPSGGNVYLVGPAVTNNGIITSPKGEVVLAAGNRVELVDPATPNLRVEIAAPDNEAVNLGRITAEAGRIGIYAGLINQRGLINADSVVARENGSIVLRATRNTTLEAGSVTTASGPSGGNVTIQSGDTTVVLGDVAAKGADGKGGNVQVLGNLVGLAGNASVDASGLSGGGTVLVGGDFQGKNPEVQNAFRTFVGPGATIKADAIGNGDGGKVIVWADDATRYYGNISARGGAKSGDGGFVEVSGKGALDFRGGVQMDAPNGKSGTLLLDPTNISVVAGAAGVGDLDAFLPDVFFGDTGSTLAVGALTGIAGGTILLQATNNIQFNTSTTLQSGVDLLLDAGNDINIGTTASATITAQGAGTLTLRADANGPDGIGAINVGSASFNGSLVTANQPITLQAATLGINATNGTVNAGTSQVNVFTSMPTIKTIGVGTATGDLTLDNTTMGKITAGTLMVGDITAQQGNITIKGATPPTGKNFAVAQLAAGTGAIILDDTANTVVPITTGTGNISLSAGKGGITANATNTTAEFSSSGSVTLNTSGPIGSSANRIDILAGMEAIIGNVTAPTGGVFLNGLSDLTLGAMTIGGNLDVVTAAGNISNLIGAITVTGTSRFDAGTANITLDAGGHDFQGAVTLAGDDVSIHQGSANPLVLAPFNVSQIFATANASEIRLSGSYTSSGGAIDFNSPTTRLTGNTTITGAQAVFLNGDVLGPGALTLNQNSGTGVVQLPNNLGTAGVPLAGLTINNASTNNLSFNGANVAGNVDVTSAGNISNLIGAITVTGTSRFDAGTANITLDAGGHDFQGAVTLAGTDVSIHQGSANPLVLAPFNVSQIFATANASEIRLSGIYTTTGGAIDFNSPTTRLTGNTTITGAQAVFLNGDVLGPGALTLNQNSGTGVVQLPNNLGTAGVPLAGLTINNASTNNLSFNGANVAGNVDVTSAGNISNLIGAITVTGTSRFDAGTADISLDAGGHDFQGAVTLAGTDVSIHQGSANPLVLAPFNVSQIFATANASEIRLSGIYTTTGGAIDFNSPTTRLTGPTTITGAQAVFLHNDVLGPGSLILNQNSGTGVVQLPNNLGTAAVPLAGLTINNASTNNLSFNGANVAGNVNTSGAGLLRFTAPVTVSGNLVAEAVGGDIEIGAGAILTANGTGNALTLAGTNFINSRGIDALSTPSGRWLVYSTSPAGSTENGLTATAGSATPRLYNRTFAADPPTSISEPGNHLIYNSQPALNVAANGAARVYGDANPAFTFLTSGFLTDDGVTDTLANAALTGALTTSAVVNSPVSGSPYAITQGTLISSSGYSVNYTGANMTVTPRPITATADAGQNKVYGNADPAFAYSITSGNLVGTDTLSGTLARTAGENVGAYAINQGTLVNANYAITFAGNNFGITQRPITVTANAGQSKVYGNVDPAFAYSITSGNLVGADTLSGTLARAAGESAGVYAINQGTLANTNYTIAFSADNFGITQRPITVMASAGQNKIYGSVDPTLTYSISGGSLVGADALGGALDRVAGENVGVYGINLGTLANSNYVITYSGNNFAITPAPLTVTADFKSRVEGITNPSFTASFAGFVLGDTSANLSGVLSLTTPATAVSPVGSYSITPSGLSSTNYALTYVNGILQVTSAPPSPPPPFTRDLPENSELIVAVDRSGRFDDFMRDRDITIRRIEDEKQSNPNVCR